MKRLAAPALAALLPALLAAPALAAPKKKLVVLEDGQTLEGYVTIEGDEVVIRLGGERFDEKQAEIRIAAESVKAVEEDLDEELIQDAVVELKDGRALRGTAAKRGSRVIVRGKHGELEVGKDEVLRITKAAPELPKQVIDGDLGLVVGLAEGWLEDDPVALGERLRLVHESARGVFSVQVRALPPSGDAASHVRRALDGDLSPRARLSPRGEGEYAVEDERRAYEVEGLTLRVRGRAVVRDDVVVWIHGECEPAGLGDEGVAVLDELVKKVRFLAPTHSEQGLLREAGLRLLVETPSGMRLKTRGEGQPRFELRVPGQKGARLEGFVNDDPDARAALLDRLGLDFDEEALSSAQQGGLTLWRAGAAELRAVAWTVGERTLVIKAHAKDASTLARLGKSVRVLAAGGFDEDLEHLTRLVHKRGRIRGFLLDERLDAARRAAAELEEDAEDDPRLLGLKVAIARARKREVIEPLEEVWASTGAAWVAEELGQALVARARAAKDDHVAAADAFEKAAEVLPTPEVLEEGMGFFLQAAEEAYEAGERIHAWARLARARSLIGSLAQIDDKEAELRLRSAKTYLEERKPKLARGEARRAWSLGAEARAVETIYTSAENIQRSMEREREIRGRRRGNGFRFGLPPSLNRQPRGGGRVRATAFTSGNQRSRFVRQRQFRRSRRVNRRQNNTGRRGRFSRGRQQTGSRRVRSNGGFAFN